MRIVRMVVRVTIIALVCTVGTSLLGWLSVPIVGLIYGILQPRVPSRGSIAALGAALGWAGLLGEELAGGADIHFVAAQIGAVMHLPAGLLVVLTLGFGAVLAGTAAVVGAGIAGAVSGASSTEQVQPSRI